jgi:hypothetical protein
MTYTDPNLFLKGLIMRHRKRTKKLPSELKQNHISPINNTYENPIFDAQYLLEKLPLIPEDDLEFHTQGYGLKPKLSFFQRLKSFLSW